jgi:hypothetical protein
VILQIILKKISLFLSLCIPCGLYYGYRYCKRKFYRSKFYIWVFQSEKWKVISRNIIFNDCHKGERCFVLGTGFSINDIDIIKLKNEHKIFMSQFYHHKNYLDLNPKYHLFNDFGGHPHMNQNIMLDHYRQIDARVPDNVNLFFRYNVDYEFIKEHRLFKNKKVYYIDYMSDFNYIMKDGIDASRGFYHPNGCAISGIQLALCMGFKEIYLLGIDYDFFRIHQGNRFHFYDETLSVSGVRLSVNDFTKFENMVLSEQKRHCEAILSIYQHHQIVNAFCRRNGIKIFNLSEGSLLDIISRKNFDTVFR